MGRDELCFFSFSLFVFFAQMLWRRLAKAFNYFGFFNFIFGFGVGEEGEKVCKIGDQGTNDLLSRYEQTLRGEIFSQMTCTLLIVFFKGYLDNACLRIYSVLSYV